MKTLAAFAALTAALCMAQAALSAQAETGTLMAVDALGRAVPEPGSAAVPAPRDRKVGLFYFLWCGEHGKKGPYDVSKILAADPKAGYKPKSPLWGGEGVYHHWGEPFFGYYFSNDEWVVRRHMKLLTLAGVDFIFFDATNSVTYEHNVKLVMRVLQEYKDAGWKVPKVMFYTKWGSGRTVQRIYNAIYKPGYCRDLWFYFDGKPIIIGEKKECSEETKAFFTFRAPQWPREKKVDAWPWIDFERPQQVSKNSRGETEMMTVSVAQHTAEHFGDSPLYGEKGNRGRAFHNGANDPAPDAWLKGFNFAEQFEHALKTDPPLLLVTGWNEWIIGYWKGRPGRPIRFVDSGNYEYSRDIEMMRGGYGDNYFMQLVGYVRRYKGAAPQQARAAGLAPAVYDNFPDGDFARNAPGYGRVYENRTQRNAIRRIEMWHDSTDVHVRIKAKKPIDPKDREGTWMKLYLNTDGGRGYGFVANNASASDGIATLAKVKERGERLACEDMPGVKIPCRVSGDSLELAIPRAALGIGGKAFTLWFKVADSRSAIDNIVDFYDHGDVAPLGRLNYVYKGL